MRIPRKIETLIPLSCALTLLMTATPVVAEGNTSGKVTAIQSYKGHGGLLVQLSGSNQFNPDSCPSAAWYIFPDDSQRVDFVQSALLTALYSGKTVHVTVRDCFQAYPVIVHVSFVP